MTGRIDEVCLMGKRVHDGVIGWIIWKKRYDETSGTHLLPENYIMKLEHMVLENENIKE